MYTHAHPPIPGSWEMAVTSLSMASRRITVGAKVERSGDTPKYASSGPSWTQYNCESWAASAVCFTCIGKVGGGGGQGIKNIVKLDVDF